MSNTPKRKRQPAFENPSKQDVQNEYDRIKAITPDKEIRISEYKCKVHGKWWAVEYHMRIGDCSKCGRPQYIWVDYEHGHPREQELCPCKKMNPWTIASIP